MNIIIAGDGEVGFHLAKSLSKIRHNITVIDPHSDLLAMLQSEADLMTITGSSTSIGTLKEAGVSSCDLLISALHDENINLITCILGKRLGVKRTIARVSSIEYLDETNKQMFKGFGVDEMVSPERIAAKEITNLLTRTAATEIFDFANGLLSVYMMRLGSSALILDKTLAEISKEYPDIEARTIRIIRQGKVIIPDGNDKYLRGDMIYLVAKASSLEKINELGGKKVFNIKSAIIAGGGRVARRTAMNLQNTISLKIIEKDRQKCFNLSNDLSNTMIINGDANDISLLMAEGLENTDAFIAVTESTETNILSCLHAHKHGVKKTIALVENISYIDVSQDIGIDTIINKKLIAASYIARFTLAPNVTNSKWLAGMDAECIEIIAKEKSLVTKIPLRDLKIPYGASIGGIIRHNTAYIAKGDFQIETGDRVVVFTSPEAATKIVKLFN
ncbi:MAG: Trk system potassium transporter TrkA [Bacteroidales bacterium]|jgi:trk system potassium uptake protein TrkA|nr:Trk system potassium transporter TrkA [Bacteroidales bacterium]